MDKILKTHWERLKPVLLAAPPPVNPLLVIEPRINSHTPNKALLKDANGAAQLLYWAAFSNYDIPIYKFNEDLVKDLASIPAPPDIKYLKDKEFTDKNLMEKTPFESASNYISVALLDLGRVLRVFGRAYRWVYVFLVKNSVISYMVFDHTDSFIGVGVWPLNSKTDSTDEQGNLFLNTVLSCSVYLLSGSPDLRLYLPSPDYDGTNPKKLRLRDRETLHRVFQVGYG